MATQKEQVFHDALQLEAADRTQLLELLIESLDADADEGDVEAAWAEEVDRRIAQLDEGTVSTEPWD